MRHQKIGRMCLLLSVGAVCFVLTHMFTDDWLDRTAEPRWRVLKIIQAPKHPHPLKSMVTRAVGIEEDGRLIGAGVLLSSNRVLTAAHVVARYQSKRISVRFGRKDGAIIASGARVIAIDQSLDLALLSCYPQRKVTRARIATEGVQIYSPLVTVGSPYGIVAAVVSPVGYLAAKEHEFSRCPWGTTWMCSIPATYGNSGGGVFCPNSGTLIGILIAGPDPGSPMSEFVSPETIRGFIDGIQDSQG